MPEKWSFWGEGTWEDAQQIEQFRTADGKVLMASQVDQMVQAMADFDWPEGKSLNARHSVCSLNAVRPKMMNRLY